MFDRHTIPPKGWIFREPSTGWTTPTPVSSTFDQVVQQIIAMRRKNPAITAKLKLATDKEAVAAELERYTRKRLGLPEGATPVPFPVSPRQFPAGAVAVVGEGAKVDRTTTAFGIKRAAAGNGVVVDWLMSGGAPVAQQLAFARAETCVNCSMNVPGSWYTVAPAELIRETLSFRSDVKLETPFDDRLKSCDVCRCLNRLKVWCPMAHIVERTRPDIMAEFPPHCWIAQRK